jgi:hypothetical protein
MLTHIDIYFSTNIDESFITIVHAVLCGILKSSVECYYAIALEFSGDGIVPTTSPLVASHNNILVINKNTLCIEFLGFSS